MAILEVGSTLGERFELRGVLGSGGMATVWLAWDRTRKAEIALKILHPQLVSSNTDRRRIQREVRATASLRHPAVLAPYDLHDLGDVVGLSMPLHRGATLLDHVADGRPMDAEAIYDTGIRIADAIAAAHDLGVLHRDVTPANIMVTAGRDAMLVDFGLARLADTTATATRAMATPGYTAPEVFAGDRSDPRSDLYGLGASLYYAATGRSPFSGRLASTLVGQQLSGGHTPLGTLRPDLPPDLTATIESLLAPMPRDRPATAAAVARALRERAAADATHSASLEAGESTLWVEHGDEDTVSRVLRRRGVVPGHLANEVPRRGRPWPAIAGISTVEAASLGRALSIEGVNWSVEDPTAGALERLTLSTLFAAAVSVVGGLGAALLSQLVLLSGQVAPLGGGPFGEHPVLRVALIAMFVCFTVAFSAVSFWRRPRPVLGRRTGLADAERSLWVAGAIAAGAFALTLLPALFLAPIGNVRHWFVLAHPTPGIVAFANFALVGSWGLILLFIGLSAVWGLAAGTAEFRSRARATQRPWFRVPATHVLEDRLPETVAVARERLASARRWLFAHADTLPDMAVNGLSSRLGDLQRQVDALAEQSRALDAAAAEVSDADLLADASRIERRLERLATLGDAQGPLATELAECLAEHRAALASAEALENRRLRIRAALVRIATTASNTVVALIGDEQDTDALLDDLSRTVTDARSAIAEVQGPLPGVVDLKPERATSAPTAVHASPVRSPRKTSKA